MFGGEGGSGTEKDVELPIASIATGRGGFKMVRERTSSLLAMRHGAQLRSSSSNLLPRARLFARVCGRERAVSCGVR
eukprot:545092-Pleurochrysis_carterae.AAC.2